MKSKETTQVTIKVLPFLIPTWAAGQTWGTTILLSKSYAKKPSKPSIRLIAHELVHVDQWKYHRWTFPFKYAWELLKNGYENNRFEVEARKWEQTGEYQQIAEKVLEENGL